MESIKLTKDQASTIRNGGEEADKLISKLRREAQALADKIQQTVEIYHPEGYVWDARTPS